MKSLWRGHRPDFLVQELVIYGVSSGITSIVCLLIGGLNAFLSSLIASAIYILPSSALLLISKRLMRTSPLVGAQIFQIGLFARTFLTTILMVVVALVYKELHRPAFLLSLFIVVSAPMAGQLLLKR